MKTLAIYLILFVSLLSSSAWTQSQTKDEIKILTERDSENCDSWNKIDWDTYIQFKLFSSEYGDHILERLREIIKRCKSNYKANGINKCTQRIENYYKQFDDRGKGMYSTILSDEDYVESIPREASQLPDELKNSPRGLPPNWKELAQKKGWQYVIFHSDTGDSARLVMRVPGKNYDKLLVYHASKNKTFDVNNLEGVQMQAIEKNKSSHPQYYFKSFDFEQSPRKIPWHSVQGGRCVQCHWNGPRAIVPNSSPNFPTELGGVKSVEEFNSLIVMNTQPDLSPFYDLKNFPTKLQVGTNCKSCHDGKTRASLAFSVGYYGDLELHQIHRKVIDEKSMPLGASNQLARTEREAIVENIKKEYRREIQKWLTETPCEDQPAATKKEPVKNKNNTVN